METFDIYKLKAEIDNDPDNLGYWNTQTTTIDGVETVTKTYRKSSEEIQKLLNTPSSKYITRPNNAKTPLYIVYQYLSTVPGFLGKIKRLADDNTGSVELQSAAIATQQMFVMNDVENCDLDSAPVRGAMNGFIAAGVLTQEQLDGLLLLGNKETSRAEYLWGYTPTSDEVNRVLSHRD